MTAPAFADPERGTSALPWVVASAAVGGALYWRSRRSGPGVELSTAAATAITAAAPATPLGRWVWPLRRWEDRDPVISDGYGSPRPRGNRGQLHRGVDLMYRRRGRGELADRFPLRAPHSRGHFLPPGTLAVAAADGEVWSAGWTPRGYSVVISHGKPWATYYTHLSSLLVKDAQRGSSGERVIAGQPIGVVGADPQDEHAIAHVHFEIWRGGAGESAIDPAPLMRSWSVLPAVLS